MESPAITAGVVFGRGMAAIIATTLSGMPMQNHIGKARSRMRTPDTSKAATIELPLSPSVAAVIAAMPRWKVRPIAILVLVVVAALFVVGTVEERSKSKRHNADPLIKVTEPRDSVEPWIPIIAAVGTGISVVPLIFLLWFFGSWLPARRDLGEGKYLRTSGPITFYHAKGGYTLRLFDRKMPMDYKVGAEIENGHVEWAVVDYARHTQIIFGVWDQKGKVVFLAKGYSAPPLNSHT